MKSKRVYVVLYSGYKGRVYQQVCPSLEWAQRVARCWRFAEVYEASQEGETLKDMRVKEF